MKTSRLFCAALVLAIAVTGCALSAPKASGVAPTVQPQPEMVVGDRADVTRVIDGDTIEVEVGLVGYRVRYLGMNTPERNEACYQEATDANKALVAGKTVTLVRDVSNTDIYGRLLRYVYVDQTFVNAQLVADGWAEGAEYPPDVQWTGYFRELEKAAIAANVGCHPTGIFNDGSETR